MLKIAQNKIIKDNVHGYIEIPSIFLEQLVDTRLFQRLREIEQTGMRPVYPGASHDRFAHSLGVYHLGYIAFNCLVVNNKSRRPWRADIDPMDVIRFWAENKVLFLIACLLHDVGHTPFSHSLEKLYPQSYSPADFIDIVSDKGNEAVAEALSARASEYSVNGSRHEVASALLAMTYFKEAIRNILCRIKINFGADLGDDNFTNLYDEQSGIEADKLEQNLDFIGRMITGTRYTDVSKKCQIRNCLISLLNGKFFDVDKLDYIIRDTFMSGIDNVTIDTERLLRSLIIIEKTEYVDYEFRGNNAGRDTKEMFIIEAASSEKTLITIDGEVDGKIVGGDAIEKASLKEGGVITIPSGVLNIHKQVAFTPFTSELILGGYNSQIQEHDNTIVNPSSGSTAVRIIDGEVAPGSDFEFSVPKSDKALTIERVLGHLQLRGKALGLSTMALSGKIRGRFKQLTALGDKLTGKPNEDKYNSYLIGFNKQALNIIQNVVFGRNYLYLWIYAHHKVVYYSNFLLRELLHEALPLLNIINDPTISLQELVSISNISGKSKLNSDYHYFDDASFRGILNVAKKNYDGLDSENQPGYGKFLELYEEFATREYKHAVYKSLAEYNIFFKGFTKTQKQEIRRSRLKKVTESRDADYGFWVEEEFLNKLGLKSLMWIDAQCSIKNMDIGQVFIEMKENEVVIMKSLDIFSNSVGLDLDDTWHYFYLYYLPQSTLRSKPDPEFKKRLVNDLRKYFRSLLH